MNRNNPTSSDYRNRISGLSALCCRWSKFAAASLVLAAAVLCAIPVQAQTATFKSTQLRATVPLNFIGTVVLSSNLLTIRTNGATLVPDGTFTNWFIATNFIKVTGAPAGVTATAVNASLTQVDPIGVHLNTNSTSTSTNIGVLLNFDGSTVEGLYTLSLNVTNGVTNNIFLNLQVGSFWGAPTTNANYNWSSTANWAAGALPAGTNDVIFAWDKSVNMPPNLLTNSTVDQNFTIRSLRFAQTNSNIRYNTLDIQPGVNLAVAGAGGFSVLKDYINIWAPSTAAAMTTTITGPGGTLLVTNEQANFVVLNDNAAASGSTLALDMAGLGTFISDVNAFGLGDGNFYPNFRNLNDANAFGGQPRTWLGNVNLARTNVIKAVYADPFNYTNADDRTFSFNYLRSEVAGSTTVETLNLGISNIFYVDSINLGGGNSRATVQFNPNFTASNPIAIFRGTNGGRMSVFAIADGAGTNASSTSPNNNANFLTGTVDLLTDRFYIGRDRKVIPVGQNPSYVGNFFMSRGIADVNTAILGFREYNQTNASLGQISLGYCVGRITVSNTAVFKVSQTLTLGSTVATNVNEESSGGNCDQGQITVTGGGTLMVNRINVGGPVYGFSRNNNVTVSGVVSSPTATLLVVSNTIAGTNQYLDNFTLSGGSTLQMKIDGTHSGAYIFTTNLTFSTTTTNNVIQVASMQNLPPNAQVPLIFHATATAGSLPGIIWPVGFTGSGSLLDNGAGSTVDLLVSTLPAKSVIWRGAPGAVWDLTTKNWLDPITGLMTNFNNFDIVAFDNAAGYGTNISVNDIVIPGAINMTNNAIRYTLASGGGSISGSGLLSKTGTGTLELEVGTTIPYAINQGRLINGASGIANGVTIAAGAVLNNEGTINSGVACSGAAFIDSGSTVNGPLTIQSGGVVTNMATIQGGPITLETNSFLYNGSGATLDNFSTSTVATNATLVNDGFIGTQFGGFVQTLTVSGTLFDTGASGQPSMSMSTLTIAPGGLYIPGGDGIGASYVRNPLGITTGNPGRLTLSIGSTNILKVDPGTSANTDVRSFCLDFGPSQSSQQQNGCTLVITNVGVTPFANGQTFRFFQLWTGGNPTATGTSTNSFPIIVPPTPGPGLSWDLSQLWGTSGHAWGYIGVVTTPVVRFTNSFSVPDGTNVVGQFSWPATNYGWRLQTLVTPTSVGLNLATNAAQTNVYTWTGIAGSWTNLSMTLSNRIQPGTNVFYRLVYP